MNASLQNDIVTIVRDPSGPLGKIFADDGKRSAKVALSLGLAKQHHVPDAASFVKVLDEVADDPRAALINSSFPGIPVGEEFLVLSENQFKRLLKLESREQMAGIHELKHRGKSYRAVGRFKENVRPSTWQLLDRDVDEHTPAEYARLDHQQWLDKLELILPGLGASTQITVPSASSRVTRNRKPIGKGNAHTWVQTANADDAERVRSAMRLTAMDLGLSWKKPRRSRLDRDKIIGHDDVTILDTSVWTPGRLVFDGKPTVAGSLRVIAFKPTVKNGTRLDTSLLKTPTPRRIAEIAQKIGIQFRVRPGRRQRLAIDADDVTLATEIELSDGRATTVEGALKALPVGEKLRCQTPFRESSSFAAFLSRSRNGKPFIFDSGTDTTHWLNDEESAQLGFGRFDEDVLTVAELKQSFEQMADEDVREEFAAPVVKMPQDKQEEIYEYLKARLGISRALFKAALTAAKDVIRKQAADRAVGDRTPIVFTPDDYTGMARQAETAISTRVPVEEYCLFACRPAQLIEKEPPGMHRIDSLGTPAPRLLGLEPLDEVSMRAVLESNVVFQTASANDTKNIAVPDKVIETLLKAKDHNAPSVSGLLMHPVVLPDGAIVAGPGYDAASRLYIGGAKAPDIKPFRRKEARQALQRIRDTLLREFSFRSPADAEMAAAALLTGVVRRVLDVAPGFAFLAPIQSSGKTTLARMIHIILTDRDMPVSSFAEGDEAEMQKRMLAMLMRAPAMVCLDNITDGTTFQSSALSSALTSPTYLQRVLGVSAEAECLTNVLFIATGNNLSFGGDEASRWVPVHLDPKSARPHERKFMNADVVAYARSIRDDVLHDCIGIIAGFLKYATPAASVTRFPQWDRMVRQPLLWAGAADPVDAFRRNESQSSVSLAGTAAVLALEEIFSDQHFYASEVAQHFCGHTWHPQARPLAEALSGLRARQLSSPASVGRALSSILNKIHETSKGSRVLRSAVLDGNIRYRVESIE